jgi:hypothetical protein
MVLLGLGSCQPNPAACPMFQGLAAPYFVMRVIGREFPNRAIGCEAGPVRVACDGFYGAVQFSLPCSNARVDSGRGTGTGKSAA